jgi:hypothetical protein
MASAWSTRLLRCLSVRMDPVTIETNRIHDFVKAAHEQQNAAALRMPAITFLIVSGTQLSPFLTENEQTARENLAQYPVGRTGAAFWRRPGLSTASGLRGGDPVIEPMHSREMGSV